MDPTSSWLAALGLSIALCGLVSLALQLILLARHLRIAAPAPRGTPGISVLKPLCGVDDSLRENLDSFGRLDYPRYEVLLGVRSTRDAAYPIACQAVARWPERMRIVLQRGERGLNPKVNQLITLESRAVHELLVISDSNVSVEPDYLDPIAGYFERPEVGLVTHPVTGIGERTLGAYLDNVHLSAGIAPGMVAASALLELPIVVGKSMALRRGDLRALGGFEAVNDVLAEDFVLGRRVADELGKTVVIAHRPISAVSQRRTLRAFLDRYSRWGTIQRCSVGLGLYFALLLQHPLAFAALAVIAQPALETWLALGACCALKAAIEHEATRRLRGSGSALRHLLVLPLKDAILLLAWVRGLLRSQVSWRGTRLAVRENTSLVPIAPSRVATWLSSALTPVMRR